MVLGQVSKLRRRIAPDESLVGRLAARLSIAQGAIALLLAVARVVVRELSHLSMTAFRLPEAAAAVIGGSSTESRVVSVKHFLRRVALPVVVS